VIQGNAFDVWDGHQVRDFTYVDDAVEAFLLAAASDAANGQVFNLGGEAVISLKSLAELLVKVSGSGAYALKTFPSDRKKIDIGDYYSNFDRIRSMLGWEPRVPLSDGLARTVAFYRQHLAQYL